MTRHHPRRALVALVTVAAVLTLPSVGAGRALTHPDGPDCSELQNSAAGIPAKSGVPYILQHGFKFGFECGGYYLDGDEYRGTNSPDGKRQEYNTDTNWPLDAEYTLKAEVTMPANVEHALGLSSRVAASGTLTGPKPYRDLSVSRETDVWTLKLNPAFKAALKRARAAILKLDYKLDVSLPGFIAPVINNEGVVTGTKTIPASVAHISNGGDFAFVDEAALGTKCKIQLQGLLAGCR